MVTFATAGSAISAQVAIAIPARDEAERLPRCLIALARQAMPRPGWSDVVVVILANNCTDATAPVARALAPRLPFRLLVREVALPEPDAHAGGARAAAMQAAAACLGHDGALLSTDADAEPAPPWLGAMLAALRAGADAVAGAIDLDPAEFEALPPILRLQLRQEITYARLLDRMASLADPEPHDPWPRHHWHSGAAIALSRYAWDRIGGLPRVAAGEDRALFAAVRRAGLSVRHAADARVSVSCRLDGRAVAGMAETLNRRLAAGSGIADTMLEPARQALFRLRCRHGLRRLRRGEATVADVAGRCGVPAGAVRDALCAPGFWAAWEVLEAAAPRLQRQPLPFAGIRAEMRAARAIIAALAARRAAGRGDSEAAGPAAAAARLVPALP